MKMLFRRDGAAGQALFFLLMLLGALLIWHGPAVWTGRVFCGGDLYDYFIPLREYQARHGWFSTWQDCTFSGRPVAGDIQSGLFYPPNWLHWLGMSPERTVTLLTIGHLLFGGLGMCLFLQDRFGRSPALLAGLLWTCGGYQVLRLASGIFVFTEAFAWVPWMWWAAERQSARRGPTLAWVGALALFGALQLATGAVQIVQITWCGLACWTLGRLISPAGEPRGAIVRGFLAAGTLALLACVPSLFAALQFQRDAYPRGGADEWTFLADGSLPPRLLWTWVFPEIFAPGNREDLYWGSDVGFTETNIYVGLIASGLALFALLRAIRSAVAGSGEVLREAHAERRWFASLVLIGGLALLVALGQHGWLFRPLTQFVPTFNFFRVPARWLLWTVASVCVLAAWGLHGVLEAATQPAKRDALRYWLVGAGTLLLLAVVARFRVEELMADLGIRSILLREAASMRQELTESPAASMEWAAVMAAVSLVLGLAHLLGKLPRRPFIALVLATALIDLRHFWIPFTEPMPTDVPAAAIPSEAPYHIIAASAFHDHFYPETRLVKFAAEVSKDGRLHYNDSLISYFYDQNQREFLMERPMVHDLAITRGYQQIHLRSYVEDYFASFPAPKDGNAGAFLPQLDVSDRSFLDAYNVRWYLSYAPKDVEPGLMAIGLGEKKQLTPEGLFAWPNPHARGWAWLSGTLGFLDAEPDPALGTVELTAHGGSLWEGTATTTGAAWLHLSAPDAAGWTITADGPGGIVTESPSSRTIHLPSAGKWTIRREYHSPALKPSNLLLSLIAAGIALGMVVGGRSAAGISASRNQDSVPSEDLPES